MTASYERLLAAARRMSDVDTLAERFECGDESAAAALLEQNRAALAAAKAALGPECAIAVRFEAKFFDEHTQDLAALRKLLCVLRAEAHLAVAGGDLPATAQTGLEILELANAVRRGGLIIDLQVGVTVSRVALELLRKARTQFDGATRSLVIDELGRLEAERESFDEIAARDRRWELAVGYEDEPGETALESDADPERVIQQAIERMRELPQQEHRLMQRTQDQSVLALMRMLAVDLTLRGIYESRGAFPADLSGETLPADPFTGQPFDYGLAGDSFRLSAACPELHPALREVRSLFGRPPAPVGLSLDDADTDG